MKRSEFLASLGILAGAAFIPEVENTDVERMRITSSGTTKITSLNPEQILKVTKRINGGIPPLEYRIK